MKKLSNKIPLMLALLALSVQGVVRAEEVSGRVIGLRGEARILLPGSTVGVPLKSGQVVPAGSQIVTGDKGRVMLGLLPGSAAMLAPNTNLAVRKLSLERQGEAVAKREVQLEIQGQTGSAISFLKKSDGVSDFTVKTPFGVAAARGTIFFSSPNVFAALVDIIQCVLGNGREFQLDPGLMSDENGNVTGMSDELAERIKKEFEEMGYKVELVNDQDGKLIFRVFTPSGEDFFSTLGDSFDPNNPGQILDVVNTNGTKTEKTMSDPDMGEYQIPEEN